MAFMTHEGFRLYHEDTGGDAPTVVFLHGAGGSHLSWWQQVPGSRFVRVDAAGHSTYFERPDVFNHEVGAFLDARRPS